MTLENGNIVSITVDQSLLGEDVINVFYYLYQLTDAGVTLLDMLSKFRDAVWALVRVGMNPDLVTNNFIGRNLTNGIDIEVLNAGSVGLDATGGDVSPSYVAAGYALNVGSRETRPGSKRFAGTSEQRVNDNQYDAGGTTSADIETALAVTLAIIGASVGEGDGVPHIVGRDIFGDLELTRTQPILSAQVSSTIRSQVSRRE